LKQQINRMTARTPTFIPFLADRLPGDESRMKCSEQLFFWLIENYSLAESPGAGVPES